MKKILIPVLISLPFLFMTSCGDDEGTTPTIVAAFDFEIGSDGLTVTFTNNSTGAETYSWNFGDGNTSTDENPSHTYSAEGSYDVVLVASSGGNSSSASETIAVVDVTAVLQKLTGTTSKTWKLDREGIALSVFPSDESTIYYAFGGDYDFGYARPCLLSDEYTFSADGTYEYDANGEVWAEEGVWASNISADCLDETNPSNFVNVDGADISAWASGTHTFSFDVANMELTVNGTGAFIGLAKVTNDAETLVPVSSTTYTVVNLDDSGTKDVLTLRVEIDGGATIWEFNLVSYDNPSDEPAIPQEPTLADTDFSTIIWQDEFDVDGAPDATKWNLDLGDGCPDLCGWGNNELQFYTDVTDNVRVEGGVLVIEAQQNPSYTSAKLTSEGKGDFQYGKIEARAKLPFGRGTWPAIWMLSTKAGGSTWPDDGEIDIMEHVGFDMNTIHGTLHTRDRNGLIGNQVTGSTTATNVDTEFHVYAIEWYPDRITWFIDDSPIFTFDTDDVAPLKNANWPFNNHPFHLILNIAIGGNWGGSQGIDDTIWPQKMEIDYVRVYQ